MPQTVTVYIEIPRGSLVKRDAAGRVDFLSPVPCPFNYGSVPDTQAPDGDPLDAVVLGRRRSRGSLVDCTAWAWVDFLDAGQGDPKLICTVTSHPPTMWELRQVRLFFRIYGHSKAVLNRLRRRSGPTVYRGVRP